MKKCSFIIPLYRGKDYIKPCLESIAAQTYPCYEVILIDDGSPDDTYDFVSHVIEEFPSCDIRLCRQENRGVAETRNAGILMATGDYIAFMDQDDLIKPDYLEKLMGVANKEACDIVICGFERQNDEGKVSKRVTLTENDWAKYRVITPWARVYKRSFLIERELRFLTTACCEDFYITMLAYAKTSSIAIIPDYAGYVWRQNPASVSNAKQRNVMNVDAVVDTFEKIVAALPEERATRELEEYCFLRSCIWYLLFSCHAENSRQVAYAHDKYFSFMRTHFPRYKRSRYIGLFRPKGEDLTTRSMVWGFILLSRLRLDKLFAKIWSKLF